MPEIKGSYGRFATLQKDDYHLFKFDAENLRCLAAAIVDCATREVSVLLRVGEGCLELKAMAPCTSFIILLEDGCIQIQAEPSMFLGLAKNVEHMADAEVSDDYLVHIHLDTYVQSLGSGVSDVIFQRVDEYHE